MSNIVTFYGSGSNIVFTEVSFLYKGFPDLHFYKLKHDGKYLSDYSLVTLSTLGDVYKEYIEKKGYLFRDIDPNLDCPIHKDRDKHKAVWCLEYHRTNIKN